jgi:hypothetical protein
MAENMANSPEKSSLLTRLEAWGEAIPTRNWLAGDMDYIAVLRLSADDVPELLTITRTWIETQPDWPDDENYIAAHAPVHAWRCLAQLRAEETIPVLLDMLDPLEKVDDDWFLEEYPHVFARIGPAVVPALREYLTDSSHELFARACVVCSLSETALRHPQVRDEVVRILADALSRFADTDDCLNGYMVASLLDLKATEAAEVIEQAHAADRVDLTICGNWNKVRTTLGVEGRGLVPEELANDRPVLTFRPSSLDDDDALLDEVSESLSDDDTYEPGYPIPMPIRADTKIGRNDPCPCGSGKKYKKCCGR